MVGWPDAAQDRLHADVPGTGPGRSAVPWRPGAGCRTAGAPASERGATPARWPGTVRAGRPGLARRAGTAHTPQALDRDLLRDARDAPGLAPQTGREQVRRGRPAQARPPAEIPGRNLALTLGERFDGGLPSRSTSSSHPIARASSGRTPAIRVTTTQACISEAGRRGSFSPACRSSAGGACRRRTARPGGGRGCCHGPWPPFPVREHAPVVPGCGYRVSD
jgi:hypothetical protein